MRKSVFRTTAMFRCVITLKNGMHKVVRMTIDKVAHITHEFRELQNKLWDDVQLDISGIVISLRDIQKMRFINERTNELLLDVE